MTEPVVYKSQAYFLVNQYISGIQCGIQAAHCAMELVRSEMNDSGFDSTTFMQWIEEDKTMIMLNGGSQRDLMDVLDILRERDYPYAYFNEEQDALNGALTCVGFVLGAKDVETIQLLRTGGVNPEFYDDLLVKVSQLGLAR